MQRVRWLLVLALLLVPGIAHALRLHWSSGADTLTFTEATRAILVLQTDSAEVTLPPEWRLLWVGDSVEVEGPSTPEDSTAHLVAARSCSGGSSAAEQSVFQLDLPAWGRGRCRVVALDPADSTTVLESNEVTFNGGVDGSYAPTVLRVTSDHSTTTLRVEVIGAYLAGVQAVSISAPELHGDVSLALESSGPSSVVASASIPIPLPSARVLIQTPQGVVSSGEIPEDVVETTELPDEAYYRDPAYPAAYPKDFAFINAPTPVSGVWRNLFHIFYIRHWTDGRPDSTNEVALGHAWSRDLVNWNHTENSLDAFHANTGNHTAWDHLHVWSPSIVRFGTTFYMFYTGVAENRDQTIGFATASGIDTIDAPNHWIRQRAHVFSTPQTNNLWAWQHHPWMLRDPYVMADPQNPTSRLLMFYTAMADSPHHAVGVARSYANDATQWVDIGSYPATDYAHTGAWCLESPHVFPDPVNRAPGQDLSATWRIMFTDGGWNFPDSTRIVFFVTKVAGTEVTDLAASHWSATPTNLYDYLHLTAQSPEYGHQATEMLDLNGTYYWAGYDGADLRFRRVVWGGTNEFWLADVGQIAGAQAPPLPTAVRFALAGLGPSHGVTRFRIDMPTRMRTSLVVYDVMGRKVRSLLDRELLPGTADVTWDGRSDGGAAVGTGMYFARMVAGVSSSVVRVPLVR